jgi:transcriptional regulator with XRE-family HTH domain
MARVAASGAAERLRRFIDANRDTPEWELESLLLDVNEGLWAAMQARGVSRSDLADRLGTSRAYVTKLLDGQENMTLKTLVRVANALDMKVATKLVPRERAARPAKVQPVKAVAGPRKRAGAPAAAPAKRAVMAARSKR